MTPPYPKEEPPPAVTHDANGEPTDEYLAWLALPLPEELTDPRLDEAAPKTWGSSERTEEEDEISIRDLVDPEH